MGFTPVNLTHVSLRDAKQPFRSGLGSNTSIISSNQNQIPPFLNYKIFHVLGRVKMILTSYAFIGES